jgi:hypothetical protein
VKESSRYKFPPLARIPLAEKPNPFHLQLRSQITTRNAKILNYESLLTEHRYSVAKNLTPYIRAELERSERQTEGQSMRRGSQWQMHLMVNLRVKIERIEDIVERMREENLVDEMEVGKLSDGDEEVVEAEDDDVELR